MSTVCACCGEQHDRYGVADPTDLVDPACCVFCQPCPDCGRYGTLCVDGRCVHDAPPVG